MKTKPTEEEIQEQVTWLKTNKRKIVQINAFEEDNWAKIDAEIKVLENALSEDEVIDLRESEEWTDGQYDSAMSALAWRDEGDSEAKPSANWSGLVK